MPAFAYEIHVSVVAVIARGSVPAGAVVDSAETWLGIRELDRRVARERERRCVERGVLCVRGAVVEVQPAPARASTMASRCTDSAYRGMVAR